MTGKEKASEILKRYEEKMANGTYKGPTCRLCHQH